jgi:peptide deformylase
MSPPFAWRRSTPETRKLVDDMAETMYAAPGIGLAATQVDVHKQIIVIDVSEDRSDLRVFINPEITRKEGAAVNQEGCLSVTGIYENVERCRERDRDGARPQRLAVHLECLGPSGGLHPARDGSPAR